MLFNWAVRHAVLKNVSYSRNQARMEISKLFDVTDKVVVVTGGGTGIGRMIATGFAANKVRGIYYCPASSSRSMV